MPISGWKGRISLHALAQIELLQAAFKSISRISKRTLMYSSALVIDTFIEGEKTGHKLSKKMHKRGNNLQQQCAIMTDRVNP